MKAGGIGLSLKIRNQQAGPHISVFPGIFQVTSVDKFSLGSGLDS